MSGKSGYWAAWNGSSMAWGLLLTSLCPPLSPSPSLCFSLCFYPSVLTLSRKPPCHSVGPALPVNLHHPTVQPLLHTPDHPLPPPSWPGLAEGICAVCMLGWLRPGLRAGKSLTPQPRDAGRSNQNSALEPFSASLPLCLPPSVYLSACLPACLGYRKVSSTVGTTEQQNDSSCLEEAVWHWLACGTFH